MTGAEKVRYVVQIRQLAVIVEDEGVKLAADDALDATSAWLDVALVTVEPKTKRKTALLEGLKQAKVELTEDLEARVLDEDGAYVWKARPPEPKGLVLR